MPMEIDRTELKRRARQSMALSRPKAWIVTLVYLLMTTGISYLIDLTPESIYFFLSIALMLYNPVVDFGYKLWALWTCRRLEPGLNSLIEGFSVAGRVILLQLLTTVHMMGWVVLFAIGAALLLMLTASLPLYLLILGLVVVATEIILLRYSLAPYFLADYPDLGPAVALGRSIRAMKGWTWELVKLHLSFTGWYIAGYLLSLAAIAVIVLLQGDHAALLQLPYEQIYDQVMNLTAGPLPSLLLTLLPLPLHLFFSPYLAVTLAEFYNARITLSDQEDDPYQNMGMPPL